MLGRSGWIGLLWLGAVASSASAGAQAAPEKLFEEIFGAEAKKVTASPGKADDVAFAAKLLKSSATLTEAPALRTYLYVKAFEMGLRAAKGYPTARKALNLLDASAPEQKARWDEKRLELYKLLYRSANAAARKALGEDLITQCLVVGDNFASAGKWSEAVGLYQQALATAGLLRSLQKPQVTKRLAMATRMKEAEQLKQRLQAEPNNAGLRTALIRLYLELDRPDQAVPYVSNPNVGEVWRTYVPLAAKDSQALPASVCLELGHWYKTLAMTATPQAKAVLTGRAKGYYRTHLRKAAAEGADGATLARTRQAINAALGQIGQENLQAPVISGASIDGKVLARAVACLWKLQRTNGQWPSRYGSEAGYRRGYYSTHPTATAVAALLAAGTNPGDKRAAKALNFLGTTNTPLTEGVATRAIVWYYAQLKRPGVYFKGLKSDTGALLIATRNGGYSSTVTSSYAYTYNTHNWLPPLAVDLGARMRLRVPKKYWQLVLNFWTQQQKVDGGWAYSQRKSVSYGKSSCLWTAIGSATVATCLRNLYGAEAVKRMSGTSYASLRKGLGYLEKNLRSVASLKDRGGSSSEYGTISDGLWCLSRLGLDTGRSKIGGVEWACAGADYLANTQEPDGSWGGLVPTARAVLFLANCSKAAEKGLATRTSPPVAPPPAGNPARKAALKKVGLMKGRLAEKPDSETIPQELVRLYVVELNDPASAKPYAERTGDAKTAKLVGLCGKDATALTELQCLELAEWYTALADGSSPTGQQRVLNRAQGCYQRFLGLHATGDAAKLKAKLGLQKVQARLAELKKN